MSPPPTRLRALARPVVGVVLGAVSWPVDLVAAFLGGLLGFPRPATVMSRWQRRRIRRWIGTPLSSRGDAATVGRATGYLLVRAPIGMLSAVVLGLLIYGCWAVVAVIMSWLFGIRVPIADSVASDPMRGATVAALFLPGVVLLFLNLTGIAGVAALDRIAAEYWFRPSRNDQLQRRVDELTVSRSELIRALDSERSRIERDLHDGVQQRVVALGLMVGRARRQLDPQLAAYPLLDQAQHEAADLLDDLRDVAWRVSPSTLESEGLAAAVNRLAERATPPVSVHWPTPVRLPAAVEACLFHVASEALTNIARHARATRSQVLIDCTTDDGRTDRAGTDGRAENGFTGNRGTGNGGTPRKVRITIIDDGIGGAIRRPGHGLAGLTSRVEAADGTLSISSPPSGPTRLEVTLPCG